MTEAEFLKSAGGLALSTFETIQNTRDLTIRSLVENIPGDLVECGVYCGSQVAVMAHYVQKMDDTGKRVHLFDSFQGIPEAGPMDDETITTLVRKGSGKLETTGVSSCSLVNVKKNMMTWEISPHVLVYHVGWFQDVLPKATMGPISLLRLDGDLYESTRACMKHLYPKVSRGGYVIIDDYALTGCRMAVREFLELENESPDIIPVPGGGGPVWWKKK